MVEITWMNNTAKTVDEINWRNQREDLELKLQTANTLIDQKMRELEGALRQVQTDAVTFEVDLSRLREEKAVRGLTV